MLQAHLQTKSWTLELRVVDPNLLNEAAFRVPNNAVEEAMKSKERHHEVS